MTLSREQNQHVLQRDAQTGNVVGPHPTHMSYHEIMQSHQPLAHDREGVHFEGDQILPEGRDETDAELWSRKTKEAQKEGLTADIAKQGVLSPIQLGITGAPHKESGTMKPWILGGHHRLAAMAGIDPHRPLAVTFHGTGESPHQDFGAALDVENGFDREEAEAARARDDTPVDLPPPPPEHHLFY